VLLFKKAFLCKLLLRAQLQLVCIPVYAQVAVRSACERFSGIPTTQSLLIRRQYAQCVSSANATSRSCSTSVDSMLHHINSRVLSPKLDCFTQALKAELAKAVNPLFLRTRSELEFSVSSEVDTCEYVI
jgi:hypothetical protein